MLKGTVISPNRCPPAGMSNLGLWYKLSTGCTQPEYVYPSPLILYHLALNGFPASPVTSPVMNTTSSRP